MINIDWSYAPSGATHFHKGDIMYRPHWRKSGFYCDLGLEAFGWIKDTYPSPISECIERPKKQEAWDGGGDDLPPIGTVCEHAAAENEFDSEEGQWFKVEIIAHHKFNNDEYKCAVWVSGYEISYSSSGSHFRPIKTAEQLEEEEREDAANKMFQRFGGIGGLTKKQCILVISEGYRKQ